MCTKTQPSQIATSIVVGIGQNGTLDLMEWSRLQIYRHRQGQPVYTAQYALTQPYRHWLAAPTRLQARPGLAA
jgi:hypothetical protein